MQQPWFANKGQIIQIGLQMLTILIGLKLWPEMSANHMLTAGALLFYLLMGMAVLATIINVVVMRQSSRSAAVSPAIPEPARQKPADAMTLSLVDLFPECSAFDSPWTYKSKVRAVFRNKESEAIQISVTRWSAGSVGLTPQLPFATATLQLEGPKGWAEEDWGAEVSTLRIPPGRVFRLWIGLEMDIATAPGLRIREIRQRTLAKRLGRLTLALTQGGAVKDVEIQL